MKGSKQSWRVMMLLMLALWTTFSQPSTYAQTLETAPKTGQQQSGGKRTVKGQVKDDHGDILIGVTVYGGDGKVSCVTNKDTDRTYHDPFFLCRYEISQYYHRTGNK